ncbi:MAG: glycoside hydrolase family 9 protein [Cyclobacteriaceae bacterium]
MKSLASAILTTVILLGCSSQSQPVIPNVLTEIRLNQIGYYPTSTKQFILADKTASNFDIINESNETIFSGELKNGGVWEQSGEKVMIGDFTFLQTPGTYRIKIGSDISYPFEINNNVYADALNASIKSFYFQRASMPIEKQFGEQFARASGHSDDQCNFHPSTGKSGVMSSPGGWYDAGDYGKYVVNAAITVGQMLQLVEQYPEAIADSQLNIPESGNGVSDLLDELKYELNWVLTMQDEDGGVYHKLTAKNFGGFIMPEAYDLERWIIGKGTAASLTFAAVMAQSSRLYEDKDWASNSLNAANKAWDWALANPEEFYKNPDDVRTGEYGDDQLSDEFYWAAAELFIATQEQKYLDYLLNNPEPIRHQLTNSWKFFIRNVAFHSLIENRHLLPNELAETLVAGQINLADNILKKIDAIPYRIGLDLYEWGSNSDILNQAQILCYAHRLTGDSKYLKAAQQNTDYIFGKNATGYSFLTGFGSKQAMFPHHRPSGADGIEDPVPGFIIGGPNKDQQDRAQVEYKYTDPAKSFEDVEPSYASNEVCLNWNAPAVYVIGYLEQVSK